MADSATADTSSVVVELEHEFNQKRKNKPAVLQYMVQLAQRIEQGWDSSDRMALLGLFRDCLVRLGDHKDADVRELGELGAKMKSLDFDLKRFLAWVLPVERKHTRGLRDHEFLITRPDLPRPAGSGGPTASTTPEQPAAHRIPLTLVLDNLRSAFNVGSIFRTAECVGVSKVYLCGYTATPEDPQTGKTAMGTADLVPWEWRQSTAETIDALSEAGMTVIGLETVADQPDIYTYQFPHEPGCVLVLGNERHGLEANLLRKCHQIVRIPCNGCKNSLNVGVATAITVYEMLRQWEHCGSVAPGGTQTECQYH